MLIDPLILINICNIFCWVSKFQWKWKCDTTTGIIHSIENAVAGQLKEWKNSCEQMTLFSNQK